MKKKKKLIKFICPNCNKEPEEDSKRSTENWKIIKPDCSICGAKLTLIIE